MDPKPATSIRDDQLLVANDWEYRLAGYLLGTEWEDPEIGTVEIGKSQLRTERVEGEEVTKPEVVYKYTGKRQPVEGFWRRINPEDVGDITPVNDAAERLVESYF